MSDLCGSGSKTPKSIRDKWRTPKEVFKALDKRFHFVGDMAASPENALCDRYITEEMNTLSYPWDDIAKPGEYVWLNPPYSKPGPFIQRAAAMNQDHNIGCVILVPGDHSVGWWRDMYDTASEILLMTSGRLSFINAETGKPGDGNNKGSCIGIYHPFAAPGCNLSVVDRDFLISIGMED